MPPAGTQCLPKTVWPVSISSTFAQLLGFAALQAAARSLVSAALAAKEGSVSRKEPAAPVTLSNCAERGFRYEPPDMFLSFRHSRLPRDSAQKSLV